MDYRRHNDVVAVSGYDEDPPMQRSPFLVRFAAVVGRFLLLVVLPVLLLAGLAAGLGYFRLSQGPVSLSFLKDRLETNVNAGLRGYTVGVGEVVLALSDGPGFELRLKDLLVRGAGGERVGSAPQAAMTLSFWRLLQGQVVPSRIDFIAPRVALSYRQDTGLNLALATTRSSASVNGLEKIVPGRGGLGEDGGDAIRADLGKAQPVALSTLIDEIAKSQKGSEGSAPVLEKIGLRDAELLLDIDGHTSRWRVREIAIDLGGADLENSVSGVARVEAANQPWTVTFRTRNRDGALANLSASVRDLRPGALVDAFPGVDLLRGSDVPVDANFDFDFSVDGAVQTATAAIQAGQGTIGTTGQYPMRLPLESAAFKLSYDGRSRALKILPSTLMWLNSEVTFSGVAHSAGEGLPWQYEIAGNGGELRIAGSNLAPAPVSSLSATGAFDLDQRRLNLASLRLSAGEAGLTMSGDFDLNALEGGASLNGRLGAMPLSSLVMIWPTAFGQDGRDWTLRQVIRGEVDGGTFSWQSGRYLDQAIRGAGSASGGVPLPQQQRAGALLSGQTHQTAAFKLDLEMRGLLVSVHDDLQPMRLGDARLAVRDGAIAMSANEGALSLETEGELSLENIRLQVADSYAPSPAARFATRVKAGVEDFQTFLETPLVVRAGFLRPDIKLDRGTVEGDVGLIFPIAQTFRSEDFSIEASLKLRNGRVRKVFGDYDAAGIGVDVSIGQRAITASGKMLIEGVPARMNWQRIFGADQDKQPPLRLTATLDDTDRRQLGIDGAGLIRGEVPVDVSIEKLHRDMPDVHVRADLTGAKIVLEGLSWSKQPGRGAFLDTDIVGRAGGGFDLENFQIAGDDIALKGRASVDRAGRFSTFDFPDFSLNLVSRLEAKGALGNDGVWSIRVRGSTYDGRSFFRSLFNVGEDGAGSGGRTQVAEGGGNIDLQADIATVIGFSDVNLRGLKLSLSKRNGRVRGLEADAILDGGEPLSVQVRAVEGQGRQMLATSSDAGQTFRLVNFYPNLNGGDLRLEVELDGQGNAEKVGRLDVRSFEILGDPIVAEVIVSAGESQPQSNGGRPVGSIEREKIPFDRLQALFSVGYDQFVLHNAALRGPLLGASLRGKVDYGKRFVDIGGTLVPLQGLSNIFMGVPIFGELISGPRGEGIFGTTYAVQGPINRPQVTVNYLSLVAPGILREIFQMTPFDPRVQRRDKSSGAGQGDAARRARGQTTDGWSSETLQSVE